MGGAFWFRSTPGVGSTFSFALPLRPAPTAAPPEAAPANGGATPPLAAGRPLALIIDDHRPTNKLLADWLQDAGLRTASAFDGREGLELARRLLPQLVLVDLRLPRMDGWQVLTELKSNARTASVPVVIVSVQEGSDRPSELDILDWFVKPLDRDRFIRRLRAAVPGLFASGGALTALVADDNPAARKYLHDLLTAEGIDVLEAVDGVAALEALNGTQRVDLLFLDLLMPRLDGFGVIAALQEQPRWQQLPIFIVTVKDVTTEELRTLNGRIRAVLRKETLTPEKLGERLREHGLAPPTNAV